MKKRIIKLGTHDPTLGARLAQEVAKFCLSDISGSVFSQEEEDELQRLVRKIKWHRSTSEDMKKADELTRKKWKSQGIG